MLMGVLKEFDDADADDRFQSSARHDRREREHRKVIRRAGVRAGRCPAAGFNEVRWLGWPGAMSPLKTESAFAATLDHEHGCVPVFLGDDLARDHYEGLSNASLWPLLHSMPTFFQYRSRMVGRLPRQSTSFRRRRSSRPPETTT